MCAWIKKQRKVWGRKWNCPGSNNRQVPCVILVISDSSKSIQLDFELFGEGHCSSWSTARLVGVLESTTLSTWKYKTYRNIRCAKCDIFRLTRGRSVSEILLFHQVYFIATAKARNEGFTVNVESDSFWSNKKCSGKPHRKNLVFSCRCKCTEARNATILRFHNRIPFISNRGSLLYRMLVKIARIIGFVIPAGSTFGTVSWINPMRSYMSNSIVRTRQIHTIRLPC